MQSQRMATIYGNRPHEKTCLPKDTLGAIELTAWFEPDLTDGQDAQDYFYI